MDLKTIGASGVIAVAAATAVSLGIGGDTKPQALTVVAGATTLDEGVAEAVKQGDTIREIGATKMWAVVNGAHVLSWWCNGAPCPSKLSAEFDKISSKGVSATLTPKQDGEKVSFDIRVQEGALPEKPILNLETEYLVGLKQRPVEEVKEPINGEGELTPP